MKTSDHPGLRLKIYRVNPETLERSSAVVKKARPSKTPLMSQAYPPCECPRCKPSQRGRR